MSQHRSRDSRSVRILKVVEGQMLTTAISKWQYPQKLYKLEDIVDPLARSDKLPQGMRTPPSLFYLVFG